MPKIALILLFLVILTGGYFFLNNKLALPTAYNQPTNTSSTPSSSKTIPNEADKAIEALKNKDFETLSALVSPKKGLRFSPYASVDLESDKVFTKDQVKNLMADKSKITWGVSDGSGEPIMLSFPEYYLKFIYDRDYQSAPQIEPNKRLGKSNSINNISQAYPNSKFIEYYFPPKEGDEMNWGSLRLVFEEDSGKLYLVGIIHDQWTI